jgi:hypothetical protein
MKLPEGGRAYVPTEKITDYLLSTTHPVGCAKAVFFRGLGYNESNIELLEKELLTIARNDEVTEIEKKPYGVKYVLEGSLKSPLNIITKIRTVWIVEINRPQPRFVTAYPAEHG